MQFRRIFLVAVIQFGWLATIASAVTNTVIVRNHNEGATADFKLKFVPPPSRGDAASNATISLVDGRRDRNGGDVEKLNDGKVPTQADEPTQNFFLAAGTAGGRLLVDLGRAVAVEQVNTYSWHPSTRGPQVYKLYGSDGTSDRFNRDPRDGTNPEQVGWKLVSEVDTRSKDANRDDGGQYGVSVFESDGPIGTYRYLLFDIARTEGDDPFGNTFFSEIDVIASGASGNVSPAAPQPLELTIDTEGGSYRCTIDTHETPDLTEWAAKELAPVVKEWYPKIVELLPSDDFEAPDSFSITISPRMQGVAATGGTRVSCAADWFRRNRDGEAKGAVVHELVHVVQQYGQARRSNPEATRPPGWLVEGVADYIRWFLYEPESRGAEISPANRSRARYDGSYRVSANFLNWVTENYDREIVPILNAALREGRYHDDLWSDYTGRTLAKLGDEWKSRLGRQSASPADEESDAGSASAGDAQHNSLSAEEKAAGWVLIFDGRGLDGWHSFGTNAVRPGWRVSGDILTCADPHDAGDLCTNAHYDWFELRMEYNISAEANSGIMFHVTDEASMAWATGPEFQLTDNPKAPDPRKSGWLYALYEPPIDPQTEKPLDATKPSGQWNQIRLLVSPQKCEHEINGVKYFEYVLGSDDFASRVAKSKFGRMPRFAKTGKGYIALQGDHGQVSFRNIKIRPIAVKAD